MDFHRDGATRREVMKALGVGMAVAGLGSRPGGAEAQQPKSSGTVTVSHPGTPRNLDPAKQVSGDEYMITNQVFDTLVHYNYDGKLQPLLAESWEKSADVKTWTFNLRKGVKFHHGKEMTSEDVKATVEHVLDPKTGCTLRTALEMIETIETPSPYQIRFRLKFAYAELDAPLSSREASIVAKEKMDVLSKDVSGTGPFRFKEIVQGDRAVVVKNADYWQKGIPYLDQVVFKEVPEAATRVPTHLDRLHHAVSLGCEEIDLEAGRKFERCELGLGSIAIGLLGWGEKASRKKQRRTQDFVPGGN